MNDVLQQLKTGIAQKIKVDSIDFQNAPQISKFELPAGLTTGVGAFVIAGVSVDITDSDATSVQNYAAKVKETLEENGFSAASGRNVAVDPDTGAITITFGSAELSDDVDDLLTFGPAVNTSMPEDVQVKGYQLSVTFNSSQLDSETGLANALTITDPDAVEIESTVAEFKSAIAGVEESWGSVDGAYIQSGAVSMELTDKGTVVAKFVDNRNNEIPLEGVLHPTNGTVTFSVDQGRNREVMTRDLTYTFSTTSEATVDIPDPLKLGLRNFKLEVDVRGGIPAMSEGDLVINDVPIGQSVATDDLLSPAGNAAGSAIAKAAAINRKAVASGITTGETQTLTLTGAPLAADLPRDMVVAGVTVRLTDRDNTSSAVAAAIATQLQASSLFAQNTGRLVSYQPGSTMVTVKFSENEGDVANMAIEKLPSGLTPVVETTIPHLTSIEGTGVFAKVNENVFTGQAMKGSSVVKGVIMVNGFASAEINSVFNNPRETRANTVKAINMIADKTGVRALDTGTETQGITLVAADGRNIELHFETNDKEFGQRIGMREGVQAANISLESKIQAPVILSTRGDVTTTGFTVGNYTKNESVFNTAARPAVVAAASQVESIKIAADAAVGDFSVTVNGTQFTYAAQAADKPVDIRNKLMSLVNQKSAALGVSASAGDTVGDLRLTANVPGIPFKMSAAYPEQNAGMTFETVVPNTPAAVKALTTNDLMINGVKIRATLPADDLLSSDINTSSDKSSSAIAMANAINSQSNETGVYALANSAVSESTLTTTANSPLQPGQYSLFVNGVEVSVFLDPIKDKLEDRLNNVAKAINQRMGTHGVTATINDKSALTLTSDGRNMSVWFDSTVPGLSASSFGLDKGGAKAQETTLVADSVLTADETATIQLNGQTITVKGDGIETVAALLKERLKSLQDAGEITNMDIQLDAVTGTLTFKSTVPGSGFTLTGANSSDSDVEMTIATAAGKENSVGENDVVGIYKATATSDTAKTLYGTVRLTSDPALLPQGLPSPVGAPPSDQMDKLKASGKPFTVTTGVDGFSTDSNFLALGFEVGKFGGQSSAAMDPPKVGRLAFQVGASANQMITIDLADFGKNGSITSEITGDVDLNVDSRAARINTRDGATSVLTKLDVVMDRINATRATMGAVMNRLDHVINNLTNVSMNLSASRSQIEDADYAQASTNLAKTQIMQQAATAVLAQANTSQQSVLKLLGG
jgi:flagellin